MLALGVCAAIALAIAMLAHLHPKRAALVAIFLAPWQGVDPDIGLRVTAFQLALVGLLAGAGPKLLRAKRWSAGRLPAEYWLYFGYGVAITVVLLPTLPQMEVFGGWMRSPFVRPFAQIVLQLLLVVPVAFIGRLFVSWEDIEAIGTTYVKSCVALTVIGFGQLAVWYSTGSDPLPIGLVNGLLGGRGGEVLRSGQFEWDRFMVYRMCSLGGEPKDLGQSLVVGFMLWAASAAIAGKNTGPRGVLVGLMLLAGVVLTQSTSAFALLLTGPFVGVGTILWHGLPVRPRAKRWMIRAGLAGAACFCGFVLFLGTDRLTQMTEKTGDLLYMRTLGRETYIEDADEAMVDFLIDQPRYMIHGTGVGNSHLFAMPYLRTEYHYYMKNTVMGIRSGALKIITETGFVGFFLFLWAIYSFIRPLSNRRFGASNSTITITLGITATITMFYLLRTYALYAFYISLGCALAARTILKTNELRSRTTYQGQGLVHMSRQSRAEVPAP